LDAEGLAPHKVNYVYVSNPSREANYYIDTSETMELKIQALREHHSQMGGWDPEKPVKHWNRETGMQVGFPYAERFLRITLKEPEIEAEAGSPNE
jgi:LmbE family N-acetylglucosaminyl deacetylase